MKSHRVCQLACELCDNCSTAFIILHAFEKKECELHGCIVVIPEAEPLLFSDLKRVTGPFTYHCLEI